MITTPQARFSRYLRHAAAVNRKGAVETLRRTATRLGSTTRATRKLLDPSWRRHSRALLEAVERVCGIGREEWRS